MANKLGFYLHSFEIGQHKPDLLAAIQAIQPPTILVHAWDQLDTLRRLAPASFIIGRMTYFGPDKTPLERLVNDWLADPRPEDRGRDFADHILRDNFGSALKREGGRLCIDAWMSLNEAVPGPQAPDFAANSAEIGRRLHAYDAFQVGFRDRLMEQGIEAVAFNFGAGNFATAQQYIDFCPRTLQSYTYLGFHEYGWPALSTAIDPAARSSAGTYRGIVAGLRAAALDRDYKAILTEAGLTFMYKFPGSGFDQGWLFEPPAEFNSPAPSQDDYWRSLTWLNDHLVADDWALGACLFEVGHTGRWENFRHFGTDRAGQPITIMARILELAAASPRGEDLPLHRGRADDTAPGTPADFAGTVVDPGGAPIPGALLRLVADLATLGRDPAAVSNSRGAVTWTRPLTGYAGNLWNCWQKYVAHHVAAITWEEFRRAAAQYNPNLRATDDRLYADELYFLPENRAFEDAAATAPDVVWDRLEHDFAGDLWTLWRTRLQGKVVGLTWEGFRRQVLAHNPGLRSGRSDVTQVANLQDADVAQVTNLRRASWQLALQTIVLPRNGNQDEYTRVAYSDDKGRFRFADLPAGTYRLEVVADGYLSDAHQLTTPVADAALIELQPLPFAVARGEEEFVRTAGRDFVIGGRRFRFIGVNLRGLIHYNQQPGRPGADARAQLRAARAMGARVVRVFAPHAEVSVGETVNRLRNLLNLLRAEFPDMYLIIALANLYSDVDFRVPGDDAAYTLDPGGPKILGLDWFREGYKGPYTTFARTLVSEFRGEPRIMAYNIGNELKAQEAPDLLISFMHTMAGQLREWDGGTHLISTGMISTRHCFMAGRHDLRVKLYNSPHIDFITNHAYHDVNNDAPSIEDDSDLSASLPKPLLIEEGGFVSRDDRTAWFDADLRRLVDEKRAGGFMPWGFMAGHDNNDGDTALGIDHIWHNADWGGLNDLFRSRAHSLAADNAVIEAPRPVGGFAPGQTVFTLTAVNLRQAPGLSAGRVRLLAARTPVVITGESQTRDGLPWWPVHAAGLTGFVAQKTKANVILLAAA